MAVKKNLVRIMITLPKSQAEWLDGFCKNHDITKSKYIKYILSKKAEEMIMVLKIKDADGAWLTEDELNELIRIAKAPWYED